MIKNENATFLLFKLCHYNFKILMSVALTMVAAIKFVPTQWDHFVVAAEVDTYSQVMEDLALVG